MTGSKRELGSDLAKVDATTDEEIARHMIEDDTPELTEAQLAEAEIYEGDRFIRRVGRPKGSGTKELVTLRLDRSVLDHFRAAGPGWQTRINDALQGMLGRARRPVLMMPSGTKLSDVHVVPHRGKWAVKGEGNQRAISIHDTQAEATERGRDIARRQKSELLVHGRDGQIRSRESVMRSSQRSNRGRPGGQEI
jgi:uncharacterized protein (DUF4415 family)